MNKIDMLLILGGGLMGIGAGPLEIADKITGIVLNLTGILSFVIWCYFKFKNSKNIKS